MDEVAGAQQVDLGHAEVVREPAVRSHLEVDLGFRAPPVLGFHHEGQSAIDGGSIDGDLVEDFLPPQVALRLGCEVGVEYEGVYVVDWTNSINDGLEHPIIHSTFGYAAQLVELDPESGDIAKVVAAHDVGRAVNPLLCEGQIEGAVHMGLGYALSEGFPCDENGKPLNETLRSLDIIRPKDMPPTEVILVESPDPNSPYGIKGVGEIGLVPTAGAVAAALQSHDGEWRCELPMRTEKNRERVSAWQ